MAPLCKIVVYVELPAESEVEEDECGKLIHWLYGCRRAAQACEEHYSALLKANVFERLKSVPVAFIHKERDMIGVVHGDDFIWEGCDEDLDTALKVLEKEYELENEYELKNRGGLGLGPSDVRKIDTSSTPMKVLRGVETQDTRSCSKIISDGRHYESAEQKRVRRRLPERTGR